MSKTALITGITGQDGAYLAELLLTKGYEVHGIKRLSSSFNTDRIDHLYQDPHTRGVSMRLHYGDLTDATNLIRIIQQVRPDEIYNLAAQSHVGVSFETPAFYPRSPYAAAKVYAYWITVNYREAYGLYACNGILFNHESPTRGETFVTRKITRGLTRIHSGLEPCLYLGKLDPLRDWGHAQDYVRAQWLMLQQEQPEDFVIATGEQHSVREFIELAASSLGMRMRWQGQGVDEQGIDAKSGRVVIRIDPRYFRPTEVDSLLGDPSKAKLKLGWHPNKSFADLVQEMISADLELARRDAVIAGHGFRTYRYHE